MYKRFLTTLIIILLFNCKNENKQKYESFISNGITKTDSFTFCSIVPKQIEYSYRVGPWKFESSKGYIIAEGEYENPRQIIDSLGGCPFSYIDTVVNLKKWEFWNDKGQKIEPTKKMINLISPNQIDQ